MLPPDSGNFSLQNKTTGYQDLVTQIIEVAIVVFSVLKTQILCTFVVDSMEYEPLEMFGVLI
jgi:hypothetical protein